MDRKRGFDMATRDEVTSYIRKNYQSRELDNGALALIFQLDDNRSHQVIVDWNNDEGTWTNFVGFVADWSVENAGRAVELNEHVFGIQRAFDWVAVVHPQLTETIDQEEIDSALMGVAIAADTLELKMTGRDEW